MTEPQFAHLMQMLERSPVMAELDPLALLCLPSEIEIIGDIEDLVERLDALAPHPEQPALIPYIQPRYQHRFQTLVERIGFTPETLSAMLPVRLSDARRWLLTHRGIADMIVSDTIKHRYRVVALLLVDGLSYEDVRDWPEVVVPCLVDGPSITYGRQARGGIVPEVGFAGVIGAPALARRLLDAGILRSTGFSYWERERNDVSAYLFQGIPLARVVGIASALDVLSDQSLEDTYVQLMREGLDGLAHGRREVTKAEVEGTVKAIHEDYRRLVEMVAATGLPGAVYLTADHGILWKAQHPDLRQIETLHSDRPRYGIGGSVSADHEVQFELSGQVYSAYRYPYLGAAIRANDSGVHGGLSYWESLVPFVRVEVNV